MDWSLILLAWLIATPVILFSILWSVGVTVHWSMTKNRSNVWGRGNFELFMEQFNKIEWTRDPLFPTSFFGYDTDSQIHADIIKFHGQGMTLGPIDYLKYKHFLRKHSLVTASKQKDLWSKK